MSSVTSNNFRRKAVSAGSADTALPPSLEHAVSAWPIHREPSVPQQLLQGMSNHRVGLLAVGHAAVFAIAYWLAFLLRFDFSIPPTFLCRLWITLPAVLAIKLYVFYVSGHFHGWWRYVTFSDLSALLRSSVLTLLALVLLNHYALDGQLPRAVVIADSLVAVLLLGALRASWRLGCEYSWLRPGQRRIALMVGADHHNGVLAHQIQSHPESPYRVIGFIDNNVQRHGTRLGGLPVLGDLGDVAAIATSCKASDVLVMSDDLKGKALRQLMDSCDAADLQVKIVPSLVDHLSGNDRIPVRNVEINDLLGREPVQLDMNSISHDVAGKVVMVTGAGGSIGAEICRQLLQFRPACLAMVDYGENSLFQINSELSRENTSTELHPVVADVLDEDRMRRMIGDFQPALLIHAAAHKHVGLMESNVAQCVRNNVFGTKCVADLAHEFGTPKFVLISTDKAVHPASVMGASKQIAEHYIQAKAQASQTAFVVVRFGNVLGSNGSVVPIFTEQIRRGGPVTVTDRRMTRFFMTIPEASQLVLQAASMGRGGEIYVLEMGKQIRIADLARDLIRLSGLPSDAVEIEYVGMRPGEKLSEELYFDEEQSLETSHPMLRAAYHRPCSVVELQRHIDELRPALEQSDEVVRWRLRQIVPDYATPAAIVPQDDWTPAAAPVHGPMTAH